MQLNGWNFSLFVLHVLHMFFIWSAWLHMLYLFLPPDRFMPNLWISGHMTRCFTHADNDIPLVQTKVAHRHLHVFTRDSHIISGWFSSFWKEVQWALQNGCQDSKYWIGHWQHIWSAQGTSSSALRYYALCVHAYFSFTSSSPAFSRFRFINFCSYCRMTHFLASNWTTEVPTSEF